MGQPYGRAARPALGAAGGGWRVAAIALVALTITLFILNLRCTAERAGRAAELFEQLEHTEAIHRQMRTRPAAALAIATIFLNACAGEF